MLTFFQSLVLRNAPLFFTGLIALLGGFFSILMIPITTTKIMGINAWYKPMKFFFSITIFVWTIGWLMEDLHQPALVANFSWVIIAVLAFEQVYITYRAARGELSHFNITTPITSLLFGLMGIAISIMTVGVGYVGVLFFQEQPAHLPPAYVWGIIIGIVTFVFFAFAGFIMGAMLKHTVGAPDGTEGLPVVNWSKKHGDVRIAHFFGMHGLQIIPLFAFYVSNSVLATAIFGAAYFIGTLFLLIRALMGKGIA